MHARTLSLPSLVGFYILLSIGLVGCTPPSGYEKKDGQWYFSSSRGIGGSPFLMPIPDADYATFRQLDDTEAVRENASLYGADKSSVYYLGSRISGADPASFRQIHKTWWADTKQVYFLGKVVPGADHTSFEPFTISPWARDSKGCYRGGIRIKSADSSAFEPVNFYWARDGLHYYVFDHTDIINRVDCDYGSMTILNDTYAKDKNHVFYLGKEVGGADVETFIAQGDHAKDQFRRYVAGEGVR